MRAVVCAQGDWLLDFLFVRHIFSKCTLLRSDQMFYSGSRIPSGAHISGCTVVDVDVMMSTSTAAIRAKIKNI